MAPSSTISRRSIAVIVIRWSNLGRLGRPSSRFGPPSAAASRTPSPRSFHPRQGRRPSDLQRLLGEDHARGSEGAAGSPRSPPVASCPGSRSRRLLQQGRHHLAPVCDALGFTRTCGRSSGRRTRPGSSRIRGSWRTCCSWSAARPGRASWSATPFDVQAGHNAGMKSWCVTTGTHDAAQLRAAGADAVYPGLPELGRDLA